MNAKQYSQRRQPNEGTRVDRGNMIHAKITVPGVTLFVLAHYKEMLANPQLIERGQVGKHTSLNRCQWIELDYTIE